MNSLLRLPIVLLAAVPPQLSAQTCNSADRAVAIILDASGSMNARLAAGETRWVAAQRAVKGVAGLVPGKALLSLRMYGAQSAASRKDCEDTHVAVPFGAAETMGDAIGKAVEGAKAQGYTPIAYSLEKAAADFPTGAKQRVIVLVSDGKETCKGDPVLTAKGLAGKGYVVHSVGFVADSAAQMQLKSIASATGGSYFDAPAGTELPARLKAALDACKQQAKATPPASKPGRLRTKAAMWLASHAVIDSATGKEVGKLDSARQEIPLPAGVYEVRFGPSAWKGIEVKAGETTTIEPAILKVSKNIAAELVDSETGLVHGRFDAVSAQAVVMPGIYDVVFPGDRGRWAFVKLDGGKTVTLDPVEVILNSDLKWQKAHVLRDGKPVAVFDRMTWRHRLPPAEYMVEVDGRAHPFPAVKGGEVLEIKP